MMNRKAIVMSICFIGSLAYANAQQKHTANVWLTNPDKSVFFAKQSQQLVFSKKKLASDSADISINDQEKYQTIDGYGFALTGGSAQHIVKMSASARAALLKELFATTDNNIGTSYLRVSIGASDLNDPVFSYNDLPTGKIDTNLVHFDLGPDKLDVIPVLKEILAINPKIKILGSPWSAPVWMKTNGDTKGGSLKPEYYTAYAKYFVKYIQAMKQEGITIDAVTVQNEPLHPGNNPSMFMPALEQAAFIKTALGPIFKQAGIKTKIIIYDHNADKPEYPITVLNDPGARQYIDGSAFHLYGGKIDALTQVHNAYPNKNLYFTEQWVGAPGHYKRDISEHVENLIIGAMRNWSRTVIEWNLAADSQNKPHTDRGGCDRCLGAVTIDDDTVKRNPAYYIIAHAAKFVRPGSVRIASNIDNGTLPNVAFKTREGKVVLIVLNNTTTDKTFNIGYRKESASANVAAGSVATFIIN